MTDGMDDLIRAALGRGVPDPIRDESDGERARREIVAELGLPNDLAARLRGSTDRELADDARALAAALNVTPAPALPVSLDGGARQVVPEQDPTALMDQLIRERTNAPR